MPTATQTEPTVIRPAPTAPYKQGHIRELRAQPQPAAPPAKPTAPEPVRAVELEPVAHGLPDIPPPVATEPASGGYLSLSPNPFEPQCATCPLPDVAEVHAAMTYRDRFEAERKAMLASPAGDALRAEIADLAALDKKIMDLEQRSKTLAEESEQALCAGRDHLQLRRDSEDCARDASILATRRRPELRARIACRHRQLQDALYRRLWALRDVLRAECQAAKDKADAAARSAVQPHLVAYLAAERSLQALNATNFVEGYCSGLMDAVEDDDL